MALPAGVQTVTVNVGRPMDVLGNYGTLKVTVTPAFGGTATRIVWTATGDTLEQFVVDFGAGSDGDQTLSFALPVVDQAGWSDGSGAPITDWHYAVRVSPTGPAPGKQKSTPYTKLVSPLAGQGTIDLDTIPDGTVGDPTMGVIPAVLTVAGHAGTVTVSQLVTALMQNFAPIVAHGADATAARPAAPIVLWKGSVEPDNLGADDLWFDNL